MENEQIFTTIRGIFSQLDEEVIRNNIQNVEEQQLELSYAEKIEILVDMLSDVGAQGPMPAIICTSTSVDSLYDQLAMIYPDISHQFLLTYLQDKPNDFTIHDAIDELSSSGYDKVEVDPIIIWEQLRSALPNADPLYLKNESHRLASLTQQEIDNFVQAAMENEDYPTMQDYLKNKKQVEELLVYKDEFDADKFLKAVPNPTDTFLGPERVIVLDEKSNETDIQYALTFLYNQYPFIRKKHIDMLFEAKKKDLVLICEQLDHFGRNLRIPRFQEEMPDNKNVPLLQLVAYLKNRKLIKRVLKDKDEKYRLSKEEAKKFNLLENCQCCFDEELIPEECYFCIKGCVFCKDCVKLGVENFIGRGDLTFPCFNNCDSSFSFQTLQLVLPENTMRRLTQKVTSEEIKKAKVEGLETCPFCDFAMVLPENEKLFKCTNEDCMIESCRQCRHKSHIPLKCTEIEYDEDVRRRTYIENKMTDALTRVCHSCKKTFIKTNGCNKMTCTCGAKMCYLCGIAINDYSHFGTGRCALFTKDNEINLERILRNVQQAKIELGNVEIKFDPSKNIQNYYKL